MLRIEKFPRKIRSERELKRFRLFVWPSHTKFSVSILFGHWRFLLWQNICFKKAKAFKSWEKYEKKSRDSARLFGIYLSITSHRCRLSLVRNTEAKQCISVLILPSQDHTREWMEASNFQCKIGRWFGTKKRSKVSLVHTNICCPSPGVLMSRLKSDQNTWTYIWNGVTENEIDSCIVGILSFFLLHLTTNRVFIFKVKFFISRWFTFRGISHGSKESSISFH